MQWDEFFPHFLKLSEAFLTKGCELFLVGGCVRDKLLGLEPKDYDLSTSARPELTKEILESLPMVATTYPLGERFGTIAAKLGNGQQVEITTFRKDVSSGRHPDVAFTDKLGVDLGRRDFRMNSLACSPDGTLVDPFGGRRDIENKVVACTGDAFARFAEDPLRMLRAMRFVSKFGFSLESRTEKAIGDLGNSILSVSRERWLEEMDKLLVGTYAQEAIELLAGTRLLWLLVPELLAVWQSGKLSTKAHKDLWLHTKTVVDRVPRRPDVRWAALLHDVAKPQTFGHKDGKIHFLGHDALGAEMADGIARRFKMSNSRRRAVRGLVFLHQRVSAAMGDDRQANVRALRRLVRECEERECRIEDLIDLFGADCSSMKASKQNMVAEQHAALTDALGRMREEDLRPRLPAGVGNAIMEKFGLKPGPEVGRMRNRLDKMLLEGEICVGDGIELMLSKLGGLEGGTDP